MRVSHIVFALSLGVCGAWANGVKGHCYQHFKNTDICLIAEKEFQRQELEKSGDVYGARGLFDVIKTMTFGVADYDSLAGTLQDMEEELGDNANLRFKGFSYCKGVEPYIWNVLSQMGKTNKSLNQQVAAVCGN